MKHAKISNYLTITFGIILTILFFNLNTTTVFAAKYTGDCSNSSADNVTWYLDTYTGTLTISGTGQIKNYPLNSSENWFAYKAKITNVVVENGVTSISECCFYNCTYIQSISLPDSIETIDDYAFKNCKSLNNLAIPQNVKTIGRYAFGDCHSFTDITIPDSVTSIGFGAFKDCKALEKIKLSSSITEIDNNTFLRCNALTEITIPDGVTRLGGLAFKECTSLQSAYIPATVTTLESSVFEMCTSLTSLTLPIGITTIPAQFARECTSLTTVSLPYTVNSITSTSFDKCPNLILCGSNYYVKYIASKYGYAYENNGLIYNGLIYVIDDDNAIITSHVKNLTIADIPAEIDGYPVTAIANRAFEYCYSLTCVTIPESITRIESNAFRYCYDLFEVTNLSSFNIEIGSIDNGYVGSYARNVRTSPSDATIIRVDERGFVFAYASSKYYLIGYNGSEKDIRLPYSLISPDNNYISKYTVYKYAFADRTDITSCHVSDAVDALGSNSFASNPDFTSITIPASVASIGSNAFLNVNADFSILGYDQTYAQSYATEKEIPFNYIVPPVILTEITNSMVSLEYNSIEYNGNELKPGVTVIYDSVTLTEGTDYTLEYKNSTGVGNASVVITGIGSYKGSVEMTYNIRLIKNHKYTSDNFKVKILKLSKDGLSGEASIYSLNNTSQKTVTINNYVYVSGVKLKITQINAKAFLYNTKLKTININAEITAIGSKAFYGCSRLSTINMITTSLDTLGKYCFKNINSKATIRVRDTEYTKYVPLFTKNCGFYKTMKLEPLYVVYIEKEI